MNFSKRTTCILVALLILLNIILRCPTTPHEIGWDSFSIHSLANSVSTFGLAKWWVHPLSIFGLYPYSYASAVPFLLSGISQCTDIGMEWVIWLFGVFIGIFSAFTAYLMAGAIRDDDIFKYLVAFSYSTSAGILYFSTWTVSTRGAFIVLVPLFVYLLLKTRTSIVKYSALTFLLSMVLVAVHHLFYFVVPVIVAYFIVLIFYKLNRHVSFVKIPRSFASFTLIISFLGMFLIPFFTRSFVEIGSRYEWLEMMLLSYGRMIGLLIIFIIGGLGYLLLKHDKNFEDWFLIVALLGFAPLLYIITYTKWVFLPFAFLVTGIALSNIARVYGQKKKYAASLIIIILLLSVSFAGYYQFIHFLDEPNPNKRYMEERTYIGALWIKDNINKDENRIVEPFIYSTRIFSISEVPTLTGSAASDLSYGFIDITDVNILPNSPLSTAFYFDNPYVQAPNTTKTEWYLPKLNIVTINSKWGKKIISKFDISYVIENKDKGDNVFIRSVHREKNNVYDNGKIRIWDLEEGRC